MNPKQEPKYMIVNEYGEELTSARIANRVTGRVIHSEEPLLILRGEDEFAAGAIRGALERCTSIHHRDFLRKQLVRFTEFFASMETHRRTGL